MDVIKYIIGLLRDTVGTSVSSQSNYFVFFLHIKIILQVGLCGIPHAKHFHQSGKSTDTDGWDTKIPQQVKMLMR